MRSNRSIIVTELNKLTSNPPYPPFVKGGWGDYSNFLFSFTIVRTVRMVQGSSERLERFKRFEQFYALKFYSARLGLAASFTNKKPDPYRQTRPSDRESGSRPSF